MIERTLSILPALVHLLSRFIVVFVGWHWLLAVSNAALTAAFGLGLVIAGARWRPLRLSPVQILRLHRGILLAASAKGTVLLVVGEGFPRHSHMFLVCGFQFSDPFEFLGLFPRTVHSVWYPSTITAGVSGCLLGLAAVSLIRRAVQVWRVQEKLRTLASMGSENQFFASIGGENRSFQTQALHLRAQRVLNQAAHCMGLSPTNRLPPVLLVDLPGPTPLLLGSWRPCILLSPSLATELTDAEMEIAFRHELAHLLRRDHLWRWALMWMVDVGRITGIVGWLAAWAGAAEEELCDRLSVHSAAEAVLMGSALTKSLAVPEPDGKALMRLPASLRSTVALSFLGQPSRWQNDARAYRRRLEHLVQMAREWQPNAVLSQVERSMRGRTRSTAKTRWARLFFGLLLFLVVYVKYIVYLNVF